ncbi:hypothetical protein BGZ54_001809 [Gamsiella multidivaricata]|nr:hypothetical protein BGZ54_001809 [Gamsiella multidivaricata]
MESHTSVGAGTGEHQALGSSADFLSRHREHIWAVAHEDEYGSGSSTGRDGCVDHDPSQGRYKRLQRWVAISPARAPNSTKGSSYDRVSIPGTSSRDPLVSIDRAPSRTSGKTSDARANVRDDRLLRPQRLVSEGVYGPDSFTESLEHPKRIEALLKGRRRRFKAMVHKHWRNCLCVLLFLAVTIVVPVLLLSKKAGHLGATGSVNNGILDGGAEMQPSHSIGEGHAVTRTGAVTNQPTAALAPNARITSTPTSFTSTGATKSSSKPAAQTTQIQTQTQTQTWMQTLAPTQTQPEVQQQGQTQSPQNATLP